jgi:hypothetical protein
MCLGVQRFANTMPLPAITVEIVDVVPCGSTSFNKVGLLKCLNSKRNFRAITCLEDGSPPLQKTAYFQYFRFNNGRLWNAGELLWTRESSHPQNYLHLKTFPKSSSGRFVSSRTLGNKLPRVLHLQKKLDIRQERR